MHRLKRFIYLSICLSILLFSLPFSASAVVTGSFLCNFAMNGNYITDNAARDAFDNLTIYYVAPMTGMGGWYNADFNGASFSLDIAYGGDFSDAQIRIVNNSYYEFPFTVVVRRDGTTIGNNGTEVIPAYSNGSAGEWTFNFQDIKDRFATANEVTLYFQSSLQPIYKGPVLNESYSIIRYLTPNGVFRTDSVYAPSGTYGSYETGALADLLELNGLPSIPLSKDGFKIDTTSIPQMFVIDPDRVLQYDILYNNDGKLVQINYYDQNGNFITQEAFFADVNETTFTIPDQDNYIYAPMKVPLASGATVQTFDVYRIDFSGLRDKYYKEGFDDGLLTSQKDLEAKLNSKYQEGYEVGFDDGYKDGSEITGKERSELMSDYNAITGFFDGLFNAIFGSIDIVFNGVALGGVTLGTVIWTLVIIVVVVVVGGKLL